MKKILPILALAALLVVSTILGTSFTQNPSITNTTTDQNMVCSWNLTGQITVLNVSWYNGTTFYRLRTQPEIANTTINDLIVPYVAKKGETWNCTVSVFDGSSILQGSTTTTIQNAVPTQIIVYNNSGLNIGNSTTIFEDVAYTFNVTSSDPDGDSISYGVLASTQPTGSNIIASTGIFTWTPTQAQVGNTTITFQATDSDPINPSTRNKVINFTVIEVNDPPAFSPALTNQNATQGIPWTYNIIMTDEEGDYPINFTLFSLNTNLTINRTGNGTATITFNHSGGSPGYGDVGVWTVQINGTDNRSPIKTDGVSKTTTGSFTLTVIAVNNPPNLTFIPMYNATQGQNLTFYVNGSDLDLNQTLSFFTNDTLLYPITLINGSALNATGLINITVNNSHVSHRNITISITDGQATISQIVFLNLTNTNDPPIIYPNSTYPQNRPSYNQDITNLTAYANLLFTYKINATDPDILTYQGDSITFSSNDSSFSLNATTGIFNFTKNESWIGNYTINLTVTDIAGANTSTLLYLHILNNTAPQFLENFSAQNCSEDLAYTFKVNATDAESDTITFTASTILFNISETGLINFTANQSDIGNYSINITITDSKGATNSQLLNISINNTNDPPVIDPINFPLIVEGHLFSYYLTASDEDLSLPVNLQYDNLFFAATNLSNLSIFTLTSVNTTTALISFLPTSSEVGNHSYNFSVNDTLGAQSSYIVNFTVYARSEKPNISEITPYGTPIDNASTIEAFYPSWYFPENTTTLNGLTENTTLTFNHTATDDRTAPENLTYKWYLDGVQITNTSQLLDSNHTLEYYFNFFSSGNRNVTLYVFDDMYENATFSWLPVISNVDRPPMLYNPLSNLTVDQNSVFNDYFSFYDSQTKVIDPDDDFNGNGIIDGNETNRLNYTATATCNAQADLTVIGDSLRVVPKAIGTCLVIFSASDGNFALQTNQVRINITRVPEQTQTPQPDAGGGTSTQTVTIPIPEEVQVPFPLEIVIPSVITVYENQTINIPIKLKNNWNETLLGISLDASFNVSNVSYKFEKSKFDSIPQGGSIFTSLTLWNYRIGENFEVNIHGNVTKPTYADTATVLINSLEQTSRGQQVKIKVTYARDLIDNNPECKELNEVLKNAMTKIEEQQYNEAEKMIDAVVQGCKYLIEKEKEKQTQSPKDWKSYLSFGNQYFVFGLGGVILVIIALIGLGLFARSRRIKRQKPEGKEIKH